ncbi:transporter [Lawsonibacter asaccharolyticus]|nr:transporter [Lawsonibacter asaccharolyticus]
MGSGPSEAPAPFPAERPGRDDEGKGVSRGSAAGTGGAPVRRMPFRAAPGA